MNDNELPHTSQRLVRCKKCSTTCAYVIKAPSGSTYARCLSCNTLSKVEDEDDVKEFQTWFDPIERYIHRKLEEPKIEKEQ